MNIDEQRLQQFFTELNAKRKAFDENYEYFAPQLAPQFNCFDFIAPNENKLSEIIAHLLNPQATHAQGNLFLKLFFKQIGIDYPDCNQEITTVNCEVAIQNNRRIDILVDFGKDCFGLAIENKPWTGDQDKQLSDYNEHLDKVYKGKYCLIYLSGDDSNPSPESISKEKRNELEENEQYKKINFSDIVSWLEQCEKESKSDHVKHFLRDFIAYCEQTFSGETNMIDKDMIKKTILENDKNIGLALEIAAQLPAIKEKLLDKLLEDLESYFQDSSLEFEVSDSFSQLNKKNLKIIYFRKRNWQHYSLYVSLKNGEKPNYGIIKYNFQGNTHPDIKRLSDKLNNTLGENGYPQDLDNTYIWWCDLDKKYSENWKENFIFWIDIYSDELAKIIYNKITNLLKISERIISRTENSISQED